MKILILGGAGFLGTNLVRKCLSHKNNKVTVVDSLDPLLKSTTENLGDSLKSINFIKGDIRDRKLMDKVVKNQDVIFNCAAQTSHPLSINNPILDTEINCIGTLTVLEAIRNNNKNAKVIYTASSTVTGKARHLKIDEEHAERPLDIYSANKGVSEKYHFIYHHVHGLKTVSLRFANLFGPYGKGYPEFGFINYFIDLAYNDKKIPIYGTGRQMRNVMYVEDAVDLLYKTISYDKIYGDIYFAAHREHYSIYDIAKEILSVMGRGKINKIPWPDIRKKMEINDIVITGEQLFYMTKWEPKFNLREGLMRTKEIMDQQLSVKV